MPRRTERVLIERECRDHGKTFLIEEMSALQAEQWFFRAMQLVARGGAEVPNNMFEQGAMGFAALGIGALLAGISKCQWYEVKPLWDELLQCIKELQPADAEMAPVREFALILEYVEEPLTFFVLRERILSLHLGVNIGASLAAFASSVAQKLSGPDAPPPHPFEFPADMAVGPAQL